MILTFALRSGGLCICLISILIISLLSSNLILVLCHLSITKLNLFYLLWGRMRNRVRHWRCSILIIGRPVDILPILLAMPIKIPRGVWFIFSRCCLDIVVV